MSGTDHKQRLDAGNRAVAASQAARSAYQTSVWRHADEVARRAERLEHLGWVLETSEETTRYLRRRGMTGVARACRGAAAPLREAYRRERVWLETQYDVEPADLAEGVQALLRRWGPR